MSKIYPEDFGAKGDGAPRLQFGDSEPIVVLHHDGRVEINPKYSTTDAAKAFWDAVLEMNPILSPCPHEWTDMRNEIITDGEWCQKCNAVRPGNKATQRP